MKKYIVYCILCGLLFTQGNVGVSAMNTLKLPSLQTVMKENEKRQKILKRKGLSIQKLYTGSIARESYSYKTLISGKSVRLSGYNEIDLWVQEVDLSKGARLQSILSQNGYDPTSGEPLFAKKKISDVISSLEKKPFSLINGQFFDPKREYTPLSFGVKEGDTVRSAGADNRDEDKNILIIKNDRARIVPYSWENLRDADGYLALVSLSAKESRHRDEAIGRSYICLKNKDLNGESQTLIIFTAIAITETNIEKELPRWGCQEDAVAKLDASGSTRLWVDDEYIYGKSHKGDPDYRKIPHYIAVWDN